jgi:hypothetical protein
VDHEDFVLKSMINYANANLQRITNIQDWDTIPSSERNIRLLLFKNVYWNFLSNKEDALKHIAMFVHPYDIGIILNNVQTHQRRVKEDMQVMKKTSWKSQKYGSMQITMYTVGPKKVKKKSIEYTLSFNINKKKRNRASYQDSSIEPAVKRTKIIPYKYQSTSFETPLSSKEIDSIIDSILKNSSNDESLSDSFVESNPETGGFYSSLFEPIDTVV